MLSKSLILLYNFTTSGFSFINNCGTNIGATKPTRIRNNDVTSPGVPNNT